MHQRRPQWLQSRVGGVTVETVQSVLVNLLYGLVYVDVEL